MIFGIVRKFIHFSLLTRYHYRVQIYRPIELFRNEIVVNLPLNLQLHHYRSNHHCRPCYSSRRKFYPTYSKIVWYFRHLLIWLKYFVYFYGRKYLLIIISFPTLFYYIFFLLLTFTFLHLVINFRWYYLYIILISKVKCIIKKNEAENVIVYVIVKNSKKNLKVFLYTIIVEFLFFCQPNFF